MLKNKFVSLREAQKNEDGLTIAEIIVAVTIILVTLVSMGLALGNVFEAQSVTESRNRAVAIAQDRISQAQLVSFPEVGFPVEYLSMDQAAGGLGGVIEYNGEKIKTINVASTAFDVMPYEETVVGKTDLRVFTYVTEVRENSFDGTVSTFDSRDDISPRRVSVVVEWDTVDGTQTIVRSLVRFPNPIECAPVFALSNVNDPNIPEGCIND